MTTQLGQPRQSWPTGLQENNNTFREIWLSIILTTKRNKQHGSKSTNYNIQIRQDLLNLLKKACVFREVRQSGWRRKKMYKKVISLTWVHMLLWSAAILPKKLLVMIKKYVSWVLYAKFRIEKHCLLKHFAFLINVCNQYLIFLHQVTYCFFRSSCLAHNKFSDCIVIFL